MKFQTLQLLYRRHNRFIPYSEMLENEIPYHELTLLLSGSMVYFVDRQRYVLGAGDAVFLRKGQIRAREGGENADYVSFNFSCEEDCATLPPLTRRFIDKEAKRILDGFDEHLQEKRLQSVERADAYLRLLLLKLEEVSLQAHFSPLTESIFLFLQENLHRKLYLAEVGAHTHFSPIYCASLFKQETGSSIMRYFNQLKMEKAKLLLEENHLPPQKIAERLGFDDYNYFIRLFKSLCGYTPGQYRRRFIDHYN